MKNIIETLFLRNETLAIFRAVCLAAAFLFLSRELMRKIELSPMANLVFSAKGNSRQSFKKKTALFM
jgi:hypothetical protein